MQPLKILIADDEKEARELLLFYLQGKKDIDIKECADGKTALKLLGQFKPDILFLDIKMPELTGLELMQKHRGTSPAIILTTAYDEYALPAFDYEVLDYLLKPFSKERFEKAFARAIEYLHFIQTKKSGQYLRQLSVKTGSKTELVNVEEILFFQAEGSYIQASSADKTWLISTPIYELESNLDPSKFTRIHRSTIVQINAINSIQSLLNGDHILLLSSGKELRASRTYRDRVKLIGKK